MLPTLKILRKTERTQWNATQNIVPMDKRIEEPFMMVAMIDRMKPTYTEFSDENGDKKHVVPIEIAVQMCVVPIVKPLATIPSESHLQS